MNSLKNMMWSSWAVYITLLLLIIILQQCYFWYSQTQKLHEERGDLLHSLRSDFGIHLQMLELRIRKNRSLLHEHHIQCLHALEGNPDTSIPELAQRINEDDEDRRFDICLINDNYRIMATSLSTAETEDIHRYFGRELQFDTIRDTNDTAFAERDAPVIHYLFALVIQPNNDLMLCSISYLPLKQQYLLLGCRSELMNTLIKQTNAGFEPNRFLRKTRILFRFHNPATGAFWGCNLFEGGSVIGEEEFNIIDRVVRDRADFTVKRKEQRKEQRRFHKIYIRDHYTLAPPLARALHKGPNALFHFPGLKAEPVFVASLDYSTDYNMSYNKLLWVVPLLMLFLLYSIYTYKNLEHRFVRPLKTIINHIEQSEQIPEDDSSTAIQELMVLAHNFNKHILKEREYQHTLEITNDDLIKEIAERKQAERELAEKQQQLEHTGRLAALGEMAAGVAHELSQPLQLISMEAEVARLEVKDGSMNSDNLLAFIQRIMNSSERASTIIRNMCIFARQEEEDIGLVDLCETTQMALSFFIEQFRKHLITMKKELTEELPYVKVNPQRFQQVVVNLLSNARYSVDKKGETSLDSYVKEIMVRLFFEEREREPGQPDDVEQKDAKIPYVILEVEDNGIGMDRETLEQCLEPFYTTKPTGEGTGLGLSIMRSIVHEFRGHIEIESEENLGCLFRILIPVKQESVRDATAGQPSSNPDLLPIGADDCGSL